MALIDPAVSEKMFEHRRDVPIGVPLDISTPTGMSCIGTYGENCKSDNVSKYCVLLVAFHLLRQKIDVKEKDSKFIII